MNTALFSKIFQRGIRPYNLLFIFVGQLCTEICVLHRSPQFGFFLLTSSTLFIAASGYLINDICDRSIDRINKPKKIWLQTKNKKISYYTYSVLLFLGLLLGFFTQVFYLILGIALTLYLYSRYLKKIVFIGNLIIALCCSLSIIILDIQKKELYFLGGLMFIFTFLRELVKDMEDIEGDRSEGRKTIPIYFGNHFAKNLVYVFLVYIPFFVFVFGKVYYPLPKLYLVCGFSIATVVPLIIYSVRAHQKAHFSFLSKLIKIAMASSIFYIIL